MSESHVQASSYIRAGSAAAAYSVDIAECTDIAADVNFKQFVHGLIPHHDKVIYVNETNSAATCNT